MMKTASLDVSYLTRSCVFLLALALIGASAFADDEKKDGKEKAPSVSCEMKFSLKSWSAFYKRGKGEGEVVCDNGERSDVVIRADAGGVSFGKSEIAEGTGTFSKVYGIDEVFGSYAAAEAHAGAVKSSGATAMTKGPVSLAIAGVGRGWDVGVTFGKFRIRPAG